MTTVIDIPTTTRPEVQRGAEVLDRVRPGWDEDINLATLHLNYCDKCVLGQLYEWYETGMCILFGGHYDVRTSMQHGFSLNTDDDDEWDKLTEEWRDLVASRR